MNRLLPKARGCLIVLRKRGHGYKYRSCIILAKIYLFNVFKSIQMDYLLGVFNRVSICVTITGDSVWEMACASLRSSRSAPMPTAHTALLPHCRAEGELRNQLLLFLARGNRLIFPLQSLNEMVAILSISFLPQQQSLFRLDLESLA